MPHRVRKGANSVVVHSWFMLLTDAQQRAYAAANAPMLKPAPEAEEEPTLFDIKKGPHRDEN
jgi:hypothetical protein